MSKKNFDEKIHSTVEDQDRALEQRFENIDSLLLKSNFREKASTAPRPSVIRDTFSMPESDHALIAAVITTALKTGRATTKSEVIRAGLHILSALEDRQLIKILNSLEKLTPGRKI